MKTYQFIEIDGFNDFADIIKIKAETESDAWEILDEQKDGCSSTSFLLTPKLKKDLLKVTRNLK